MSERYYYHILFSLKYSQFLPIRLTKKLAQEFLSFIEDDSRFLIIDTNIEESLIFWNWIQKNIAHADSELIYTAMKYNAKLVSYDKELMKVYEKL